MRNPAYRQVFEKELTREWKEKFSRGDGAALRGGAVGLRGPLHLEPTDGAHEHDVQGLLTQFHSR